MKKQHMSSDSSAPASVCLEGNGHPAKKREVLSCCSSVVISAFGNENSIENKMSPLTVKIQVKHVLTENFKSACWNVNSNN